MFDITEIKRNALEQGIALSQIALVYDNLSSAEIVSLKDAGVLTHAEIKDKLENPLMARFPADGNPLFPDKLTGALYLGA